MKKAGSARGAPWFEVRRSPVHGLGAFALRRIRTGTRIIEYLGERVTHQEADRRYEDRTDGDGHTFLFVVDSRTVLDGGAGGNDSRFINHSCDPNCESVIEGKRVFIEAIRTIQPGEELSYDYQLGRDADDPPNVDEIYACRCGRDNCRGSMLWPPQKPAPRAKERVRVATKHGRAASGKRAAADKERAKRRARDNVRRR
jgi:SET domain-containing protein